MTEVRRGQAPGQISRAEFGERLVAHGVKALRTGTLAAVQPHLKRPRPK
jgi:hypothetical protein